MYGVGKAILAISVEEDLEKYGKYPMSVARTLTSFTSLDAMKKELAETRKRGWAVDNEEKRSGCDASRADLSARDTGGFHQHRKFRIPLPKETIGNYAEAVMDNAKIISEQSAVESRDLFVFAVLLRREASFRLPEATASGRWRYWGTGMEGAAYFVPFLASILALSCPDRSAEQQEDDQTRKNQRLAY
jgi:hypothetical protein